MKSLNHHKSSIKAVFAI
uniref:Uncharacterized protein n=1 Tax=Anguilla anguilla TaxID=7936 RepID=A0A0E9S3Y4_ANGAN